MNILKTPNIPIWVTILGILLGLFGAVIGIMSIIDPSNAVFLDGDDLIGTAWGGRQAGLAFVMFFAILWKQPSVYAAAFIGAIWREFSDLVVMWRDDASVVMIIAVAVFMAIEAAAVYLSLRAMRSGVGSPEGQVTKQAT